MSQSSPYHLTKTITLVGMMGSGKTAVGQALAQRLGVAFLDSDEEIERAANMSIPEIFERNGEAFFRDREHEVIDRLLKTKTAILSVGGGAFLSAKNREVMSAKGVSIWLNVKLDIIWERVRHKDTRPLLRTPNPRATLAEIYHARRDIYQLADLSVEAHADQEIEDMVDQVLDVLTQRPDVLTQN